MGYNRQHFMHQKLIYILLLLMATMGVCAQSAYVVPNFRSAERYTSSNMSAISVEMISPISGDENCYEITFLDSQNVNRAVEQYATSFKFYLSYKGKRISEYQSANSNYKYTFTYKCYAWPVMVPKGNEKYVTVQIGNEPRKKDPRDDD